MKPQPTPISNARWFKRPKKGEIDNYPLDAQDIKTIFADSQRRQIVLTPAQQMKVASMMAKNPHGGITITFNKLTNEVQIEEAKKPWTG